MREAERYERERKRETESRETEIHREILSSVARAAHRHARDQGFESPCRHSTELSVNISLKVGLARALWLSL